MGGALPRIDADGGDEHAAAAGGRARWRAGADSGCRRRRRRRCASSPANGACSSPGDGHVALVPAAAPSVVQAMVVAGNELQRLPYGPGGHPDPRGALEEDCSSTVNYVLYASGVRPIGEIVADNPLAQDYVHWGAAGAGAVGDDLRDDEPDRPRVHVDRGPAPGHEPRRHGRRPERLQDGPRWRVLDHIPTWAHWSVRHPPGL